MTGRVLIRYRNLSDALVTVAETAPSSYADPDAVPGHIARCSACLDASSYPAATVDGRGRARAWANRHAAECRALPQPTEQV